MGYEIKSAGANSVALAWTSRSTVWAQDAGVPSRSPEPELEVSELDRPERRDRFECHSVIEELED